ncbi:MAG: hypothetical protein NC344_03975 [Bacteroidales bacterium]|nr:hypothetical protein [Bacteroidales bacterium]MCM1146986.1 hypothetical protein [Bacteroidales bacterium]MCM1205881.1 hypothetical protein [Bacillota bacterium]MCM1509878.1 hypothetical protein [Clostridium sp.]
MKKILLSLAIMVSAIMTASAMSYEQAREQALFLTDKMAYELDLTESQYEAAFEVNLDYLMSITTADDVYSEYWRRRNLDLSYILLDWQYRTFCGLEYFYRPIYWGSGYWHFRIFAHYPRHDFFYFGRPHFYTTYRGGHAWHRNGGRSWYNGRTFSGTHHRGMRVSFDNKRGRNAGNVHNRPDVTGRKGHTNRGNSNRGGSNSVGTSSGGSHRRDADRVRESSTRRTAGDATRTTTRSTSAYTPSRSFSTGSANRVSTGSKSNASSHGVTRSTSAGTSSFSRSSGGTGSGASVRSGSSVGNGSRGSSTHGGGSRSTGGFGGNGGGRR